MFFIDGHCDTLSRALDYNKELDENDLQISLNRITQNGGGIQVMASFVEPSYLKGEDGGFNRCMEIIKKFEKYKKNDILIKNKDELITAINNKQTRVILSIENGSAISNNLENVDYFYNKGVRIMSVTWNDDNELGSGCKCKIDKGLTKLGHEYIRKLNELNIIVDVSHLSVKGFWNVIDISLKPVIATHSNVFEICNHPRNLKDNQIKAIAKSGGIIGICYYTEFLNSSKKANVEDIVKHIKYIKNIVGIDYVGLGSDFDGIDDDKVATGVENISKISSIVTELKKQKFSDGEIEKIMSTNWSNVLKKILQ